MIRLILMMALAMTTFSAAQPVELRVMTYNIHHGRGVDGEVDLKRIADLIKEQEADIVALQEVDKGVERTQKRDLADELAELTGMTAIFSNNFSFQGGEYGNAILSRYPVQSWTNHHYTMLRSEEQRGLLQANIKVGEQLVTVLNTHIDFRKDDTERLANVVELKRIVASYPEDRPIIVCGDFNDTPDSRTYAAMAELFKDSWKVVGAGDGWTYSSEEPVKRIDYIFYRPKTGLTPVEALIPASLASDHLPMIVRFSLASSAAELESKD